MTHGGEAKAKQNKKCGGRIEESMAKHIYLYTNIITYIHIYYAQASVILLLAN